MTTNFVNVFRHFGPNAEKALLGKLGLKFGKQAQRAILIKKSNRTLINF